MTDSDDFIKEEKLAITLRQRVRLFKLSEKGDQWNERGIGRISASHSEKQHETYLQVNAETDGSLLLESKILQDTAYLKQLGRFIIWTEEEHVMGLSFQEYSGCNDVWEIICEAQGKDPNVVIKSEFVKEEPKDEQETTIKEEMEVDNIMEEDNIVKEEDNIMEEDRFMEEPGMQPIEESAGGVSQEVSFEAMLDIEHAELSTLETNVLEQLIELVSRLVSPAPEDKFPPPAETQLLDLLHISLDIEGNEGLQQVHETISYLLSLKRDRQ